MKPAIKCAGACGRMLAPRETSAFDRLERYPGVFVNVHWRDMCRMCYDNTNGNSRRRGYRLPAAETIALLEQDRFAEIKSQDQHYLSNLLRREGREDLLSKLPPMFRRLPTDGEPCGAPRGGTARQPCGRPPRSRATCELAPDHAGEHAGRTPSGRWFQW